MKKILLVLASLIITYTSIFASSGSCFNNKTHVYHNGVCEICKFEHVHNGMPWGKWYDMTDEECVRFKECKDCGYLEMESKKHKFKNKQCEDCAYKQHKHVFSEWCEWMDTNLGFSFRISLCDICNNSLEQRIYNK